MVEKGIRGGICHAIHWYANANNKYMKDYDKNRESWYLKYWDVNHLYGWEMSQVLPVNKFEWIEDASQFNEDFMKKFLFRAYNFILKRITRSTNIFGK